MAVAIINRNRSKVRDDYMRWKKRMVLVQRQFSCILSTCSGLPISWLMLYQMYSHTEQIWSVGLVLQPRNRCKTTSVLRQKWRFLQFVYGLPTVSQRLSCGLKSHAISKRTHAHTTFIRVCHRVVDGPESVSSSSRCAICPLKRTPHVHATVRVWARLQSLHNWSKGKHLNLCLSGLRKEGYCHWNFRETILPMWSISTSPCFQVGLYIK